MEFGGKASEVYHGSSKGNDTKYTSYGSERNLIWKLAMFNIVRTFRPARWAWYMLRT